MKLQPGDRVRLTRDGLRHMRWQPEASNPKRLGTVKPSRGYWIRVLWDGRKTTATYAAAFITKKGVPQHDSHHVDHAERKMRSR